MVLIYPARLQSSRLLRNVGKWGASGSFRCVVMLNLVQHPSPDPL
jgi:hypothetical protein